jgi:hypothetical protein
MGGKSAEGVNNNINKSEDKDSDNSMTESTCVSESQLEKNNIKGAK